MKVKIPKYAGGGLAFVQPNFIIDTPTPNAPITKSATESTAKSESIIDDDILKELVKSGGLTSDVNKFVADLSNQDYYTPAGLTNSNNTNKVLRLIAKVNEIKNNKAKWEEAITTSKASGGFSEVAISPIGELFYRKTDGGIGTTSVNEYKKDPSKYAGLLSVAELLQMRDQSNNLAFDTRIFDIALNSVGMDKIFTDIKDLFTTLTEYSVTSERHYSKDDVRAKYNSEVEAIQKAGRKPTQEEIAGIKLLQEMMQTPGDFLKVNLSDSRKGRNLESALKYIMGSLGMAERKKLEFAAINNGYTKGEEMVAQMLLNQSGGQTESTIAPEKESTIRDGVDKESQKPLTNFQMFLNDKLAVPGMTFALNDPKVSTMLRGVVTGISPLIKPNGQAIGFATAGEILTAESYSTFLEGNKIYFGNKKVDPALMNSIIYDNQDAAKVYLPVEQDGRPDYEDLAEFKEVYATYEANKDNWDVATATRHFRNAGYNIEIQEVNEGGKRVKIIKENSHIKPFLIFYGYTNDATGLTENNPLAKELSKEERTLVDPILKAKWTIGTGKKTQDITPDKSWHKEKYYKGLIAIPFRAGSAAIIDSFSGQGPTLTLPKYADVQRNLNYSANQPNAWNSSAAQLNQ